jgi:hypothetical protein
MTAFEAGAILGIINGAYWGGEFGSRYGAWAGLGGALAGGVIGYPAGVLYGGFLLLVQVAGGLTHSVRCRLFHLPFPGASRDSPGQHLVEWLKPLHEAIKKSGETTIHDQWKSHALSRLQNPPMASTFVLLAAPLIPIPAMALLIVSLVRSEFWIASLLCLPLGLISQSWWRKCREDSIYCRLSRAERLAVLNEVAANGYVSEAEAGGIRKGIEEVSR